MCILLTEKIKCGGQKKSNGYEKGQGQKKGKGKKAVASKG